MSSPVRDAALMADEAGPWPHDAERTRTSDAFAVVAREPAHADRGDPAEQVFGLVYRQMRGLVGRRHEIDDLVQIAAEQALRSLAAFEGRSKLSTWTYRICYLTLLKHERWYRRWLLRFSLTERGELPEANSDDSRDETNIEQRERAALLRQAIAQLSPKRRAVVVLHDLEGLGVEQIAQVVKVNPLTVRSRLRDGRKDLARILTDDSYFGEEACRHQENEP